MTLSLSLSTENEGYDEFPPPHVGNFIVLMRRSLTYNNIFLLSLSLVSLGKLEVTPKGNRDFDLIAIGAQMSLRYVSKRRAEELGKSADH